MLESVAMQFSASDTLTGEKQAEARTLAVTNAKRIAQQLAQVCHCLQAFWFGSADEATQRPL